MNKRRSRTALALSFSVEALDSRVVLSGVGSVSSLPHVAVEVAAQSLKKAATQTTLQIGSGTLGQPITFNVTVRAPAKSGPPTGTISIIDRGKAVLTLTLTPTTSTGGKYATSVANYTVPQQPGGSAYYFGKHALTAEFIPSGAFSKSTASRTFTVGQPTYTPLANGVQVATIVNGSGPQIQEGQTANVLYTGYLPSTGQIFDDSLSHGTSPLSFTVGAGQVVPGFDAGTVGMKVGESRIIEIPAAQGYGATSVGSIPANSDLLFVVTLQSIT